MGRKHSAYNHWTLQRNLEPQLFLLLDWEIQKILILQLRQILESRLVLKRIVVTFTISLSSALVRMIQWIGLSDRGILEKFRQTIDNIVLPMKTEVLPKFLGNLVIVGDLIREVVAHEVALKISETCYIPVRSFGLEQFLHGPRVTLDKKSSLVAFTSITEPRKDSLIKYAGSIGTDVIEINEIMFNGGGVSQEFTWLAQLLYGQQLALELSKRLGTNPDTVRSDQYTYMEARKLLTL